MKYHYDGFKGGREGGGEGGVRHISGARQRGAAY